MTGRHSCKQDLMESILNGIVSGVALALLIGPVFFTIIQTSIERGFWSGFFVATGVSLSDAFYIAICYLGVNQFFDKGNFTPLVSCEMFGRDKKQKAHSISE